MTKTITRPPRRTQPGRRTACDVTADIDAPAGTGGTSDPRPDVRIAAALRRGIIGGAIPPGTLLYEADIAPRFHATANAARTAFSVLRGERLAIWHDHRWYAAPGGPADPATHARMGATLTRLRKAARRTPDELADAIPGRYVNGLYVNVFARDIRDAEDGAWQPRYFWEGCDTALGADGTLLRLHDNNYNPARPATSDTPDHGEIEDYVPPPAPPGLNPHVARVAGEIAARVSAGEWPSGTPLPTQKTLAAEHYTSSPFVGQALVELAGHGILVRVPGIGYLAPGLHQRPGPAVVAVVLEWDDGTRTRLACTPAHQTSAAPSGRGVRDNS
jgi:DNA-binding GntR family transcriptional regulator